MLKFPLSTDSASDFSIDTRSGNKPSASAFLVLEYQMGDPACMMDGALEQSEQEVCL